MNRKWTVWTLLIAMGMLLAGSSAYADSGKKSSHHKGLDQIFFKKAHLALSNQEELDLSEEQVTVIRALKVETKKAYIRQKADAEIVGVDIMAQLYEDKVNTGRVNKLIDKKYAIKAANAKTLVGAYAQLKSQLSAEQMDQLGELRKKQYGKGWSEHKKKN